MELLPALFLSGVSTAWARDASPETIPCTRPGGEYRQGSLVFRVESHKAAADSCDIFKVYMRKGSTEQVVFNEALKGCVYGCSIGPVAKEPTTRLILLGKSTFSIYDVKSQQLVGPVTPQFRGIGSDAQSGNLGGVDLVDQDRILVGYVVDSGPCFFDLTGFPKAREISVFSGFANRWNQTLWDPFAGLWLLNGVDSPKRFQISAGKDTFLRSRTIRTVEKEVRLKEPLSIPDRESWRLQAVTEDGEYIVVEFRGRTLNIYKSDADELPYAAFSPFQLDFNQTRHGWTQGYASPITLETTYSSADRTLAMSWKILQPVATVISCTQENPCAYVILEERVRGRLRYLVFDLVKHKHFTRVKRRRRTAAQALSRHLNNQAHSLYSDEKLEAAAKLFGQAVLIDPKYLLSRTNLAATLARLGRAGQAVGQLREAALLDPNTTLRKMQTDPDYQSIQEDPGFKHLLSDLKEHTGR